VGAGHAGQLYRPGSSRLHRLPPECKLLAAVGFVLAVVATPREAFWAYGLYALALVGLAAAARVTPGFVARRLTVELPFVLFALLLPVVAEGPRVRVLGVGLAVEGLWGAWNILAKATLGVTTTILLAATTPVPDLLRGLERLRLPPALTQIAAFMVRYADVIAGQLERMRIARVSRCYRPRWLWEARAVAATAGTLFIRSYERGERVYLAMVSRGYRGRMPAPTAAAASPAQWAASLVLPVAAAAVAAAAWLVAR
jgi:cobalt/nickel transport system permease protein